MREWQRAYGGEWITAKRLKDDNGNPVIEALDEIEIGGSSHSAVVHKLKSFEAVIIDGLRSRADRRSLMSRPHGSCKRWPRPRLTTLGTATSPGQPGGYWSSGRIGLFQRCRMQSFSKSPHA